MLMGHLARPSKFFFPLHFSVKCVPYTHAHTLSSHAVKVGLEKQTRVCQGWQWDGGLAWHRHAET